jgi:hypothetical protein
MLEQHSTSLLAIEGVSDANYEDVEWMNSLLEVNLFALEFVANATDNVPALGWDDVVPVGIWGDVPDAPCN